MNKHETMISYQRDLVNIEIELSKNPPQNVAIELVKLKHLVMDYIEFLKEDE